MLTEEERDEWVDALTSGLYTQTEGTLHTTDGSDGWCCLGVLANLKGVEWFEAEGAFIDGASTFAWKYDTEYTGNVPPDWVKPSDQHKLSQMNDGGRNFDDIAEAIRREGYGLL